MVFIRSELRTRLNCNETMGTAGRVKDGLGGNDGRMDGNSLLVIEYVYLPPSNSLLSSWLEICPLWFSPWYISFPQSGNCNPLCSTASQRPEYNPNSPMTTPVTPVSQAMPLTPLYPTSALCSCTWPHEFASISAHFALISSFFIFACSRFFAVRRSLCARKHLLTAVFSLLHPPIAFQRKPRAWHSSRRAITSSQARTH